MTSTIILIGDVRDRLRQLPDESVHCIVTSPPYFGLRDYGMAAQIGLEPTPATYVAEMVAVFRELRRVLRSDGTAWLNLGDSYSRTPGKGQHKPGDAGKQAYIIERGGGRASNTGRSGLPDKQRLMIPARVALALQADGWWLRDEIIWHKPNPMPVSVTDRTTPAHEMLYMFSKSARYHYDMEAIKTPAAASSKKRYAQPTVQEQTGGAKQDAYESGFVGQRSRSRRPNEILHSLAADTAPPMAQPRSVWSIATRPFKGAHFATFPPDLIRPCILAGCPAQCCNKCGAPVCHVVEREKKPTGRSEGVYTAIAYETPQSAVWGSKKNLGGDPREVLGERWEPTCSCNAPTIGGTVLDPFFGAGTTGLVAAELSRNAIGIELNPEYGRIAAERLGLRALTPYGDILGRAA